VSVAGIDLSAQAIDAVFLDLDSDAATWTRYPLKGPGDSFDACRRVHEVLPFRSWWGDNGVIAIGFERPFMKGQRATRSLSRIQGAVLACLPSQMLVTELSVGTWKKATVGNGNATKDDVARWVAATIAVGHDAMPNNQPILNGDWPQDALDAYCIAYALRERLVRSEAA
jgi:Holliday junction resolvasome RuvABC endonuclease subunit